jgi:hypothetical protein
MTDHLIGTADSSVNPCRYDGWLVTYQVEIVFDTDLTRTHYDHVGTSARCTWCGHHLDRFGSTAELVNHARAHEEALCTSRSMPGVGSRRDRHRGILNGKEVDPIVTRGVD